MKTIIAGSRTITDKQHVFDAAFRAGTYYGIKITEVVSGAAPGVDRKGEEYAADVGIPVKQFPVKDAEWKNLTAPGARIVTRTDGSQYNANAAHDRNQRMADYAEALIAIWDGKSPGTRDMISRARKRGLKIYIHKVKP